MAFDYDGTLAPIVSNPREAVPGPGVVEALGSLSRHVALVAVVTGRPAQVAVDLADFAHASGLEDLVVVGHYGMERWDARSGSLHTVDPPPGVAEARQALPGLLAGLGLQDADIEDKGLSVAVHVRRLTAPDSAFEQMVGPLTELAERTGLAAEPGRQVVELRPSGMDKGQALRTLVEETSPSSVTFFGDDLGDLAAFAEVGRLRDEGIAGLLVCSGSDEVTALSDAADLVVDGPAGVSALVLAIVESLAP